MGLPCAPPGDTLVGRRPPPRGGCAARETGGARTNSALFWGGRRGKTALALAPRGSAVPNVKIGKIKRVVFRSFSFIFGAFLFIFGAVLIVFGGFLHPSYG